MPSIMNMEQKTLYRVGKGPWYDTKEEAIQFANVGALREFCEAHDFPKELTTILIGELGVFINAKALLCRTGEPWSSDEEKKLIAAFKHFLRRFSVTNGRSVRGNMCRLEQLYKQSKLCNIEWEDA
jgi:hypothetical protein